MYTIFMNALVWNSGIAFFYKILLLSHQILLYSLIPHTTYGLQSSLFAIIYLAIAITNFGFEETLLPFFSIYTQSKLQFRKLAHNVITHAITTIIVAYCCYALLVYGHGEFLHNLQSYCNKNIFFIITAIFCTESIKKSLVVIMQLAFLNKHIAAAEIIMLLGYISCVWIIFCVQGHIDLYAIFLPMLCASLVELSYVALQVTRFYNNLPISSQVTLQPIPTKSIIRQRLYNYINQLAKTIYSPNSMTIFFAHVLGFQMAATIKFFTNIITLSYTCISKSIGVTIAATFAAITQQSTDLVRDYFTTITYRYVQFLLIVSAVLAIVTGYAYASGAITQAMALYITIFFSINFLEHATTTYEQFCISKQTSGILAWINFISLGLVALCWYGYHVHIMNATTFLIACVVIKIIILCVMRSIAIKLVNKDVSHQ